MPYRRRMRFLSLAAAAGLTLALGACGPQAQPPTPTPSPTTTPFFASDEEALAAAEEVYREYLAMSDLISSEGGADPERIAPFVTEMWLDHEIETAEELGESGRRISGNSEVSSFQLQERNDSQIIVYACHQLDHTKVIDADGHDVTPKDRARESLLEVTFVIDATAVLVGGSELWSAHC